MRVEDYVGPSTLERMKRTKWYALARFLNEVLYNGDVKLEDPKNEYTRRFMTSEKAYVGEGVVPAGAHILGHEGAYIEVAKGLRELANECERMALKEVT